MFPNPNKALRLAIVIFTIGFLVSNNAFAQETFLERLRERISGRRNRENHINGGEDINAFIVADGRERTYIIHLPSKRKRTKALPLVFVLHGGGANAENAIRMSGMSDKADKEGFVAVYPNGTGRVKNKVLTWNSGNCCGYAMDNDVDDVNFMRLLIEKMEREYNIDNKRIYFTGISNGAMMSYKIACELSDKIAAIAPVAGALNCPCSPDHPVSVIIFHGAEDRHVPYNGGIGEKAKEKRIDRPVSYAVDFWLKNNNCISTSKKEESGSIIHETYGGCEAGSAVELYTIKGQGHAWPGGEQGLRYGNVDRPTQEISATDIIWEFFKEHPKE
ncbi:MAG: polyhydroxybutyrate depolymerase [Candidatus Omnitrophica bacterium]|nr:polyhydroxybutyrate depolymerase [Candidatus Omnitrophota bacterium]